jgi:probable HAF family extracellular repeat protein
MKLWTATCLLKFMVQRFSVSILLFISLAVYSNAQPRYAVHDLGTLGGSSSRASAINNSGQVAGSSELSTPFNGHAFRTAPNMPINPPLDDLGTLPGGFSSSAGGANSSGQVTGTSQNSNLNPQAIRTTPNGRIDASADLSGDSSGASGSAINDSGQVAGSIHIHAPAIFRATQWDSNGAQTDLGILGANFFGSSSFANAINNLGQVAGSSTVSSGISHAFRTAANSAINPATDDLGALFGCCSSANAINDAGQVAGVSGSDLATMAHAFRTAPNSAINPATDDLGTLGGAYSEAFGINSAGQVVGRSSLSGSAGTHAFVYANGAMNDLNGLVAPGSGWVLESAATINEGGQIAGYGTINGSTHAFRLDPMAAGFVGLLLDKVQSSGLPRGMTAELSAILNAAMDAIQRGNFQAARSQLAVFERQVNAHRGRQLTSAQADFLSNLAGNTAVAMR